LRVQLAAALQGKVVVMGIGNPTRGDDAAGSYLAQGIHPAPGVSVIDAQDVPENYLGEVMQFRPDAVVLIDAVEMGFAPGSVAILDMKQIAGSLPCTHRVPISLLADYMERETRARISLMAIQPRKTTFLGTMSTEVAESVEAVAGLVNEVLEARRGSSGTDSTSVVKETIPV
jgi:hydrogenase 3 maturation protease